MKILKTKKARSFEPLSFDPQLQPILGVDEVGRGCIAGPVCAGVVIFKSENLTESTLKTYVDSKTIPEKKRSLIADEIRSSHYWALGWASVEEIDELNILRASLLAMERAVVELRKSIDFDKGLLLVDGRDILKSLVPKFGHLKQQAVIGGDQRVRQISAASILAKVARDEVMTALANDYPEYGFQKHKGYGTGVHRAAIEKFGVLQCHRKTFGGVKEFVGST